MKAFVFGDDADIQLFERTEKPHFGTNGRDESRPHNSRNSKNYDRSSEAVYSSDEIKKKYLKYLKSHGDDTISDNEFIREIEESQKKLYRHKTKKKYDKFIKRNKEFTALSEFTPGAVKR